MKTAGGDVLNRTPANGERGVAGYDGSGSDTFWKDAEEQLASNPGQEGGRLYEMRQVGVRLAGRAATAPFRVGPAVLSYSRVMPQLPSIEIRQTQ